MNLSVPFRFAIFGLLALIVVSLATAFAAGITVTTSNVDIKSASVTAEDIKPPACHGITVTTIISGSGTLTGTEGNDLIIGSSGADTIDGLGGDDCLLGGGGDDSLTGGDGADVCLSGPGSDIFTGCELEIQ
jgi:Ca2+-binding RTX toxin-like protein